MNKRVAVMRFADGAFKLMENRFPDFKGFRYDYNASTIVMATAVNIAEGLEQKQSSGGCCIKIPIALMEKFFELYKLDIYDYHSFVELETKCTYTKNGVKLRQALFLETKPQINCLEVNVGEDLYDVLKSARLDELPGAEQFLECREILRGL